MADVRPSTGNGTSIGYTVEARVPIKGSPVELPETKQLIGTEWTTIMFSRSPDGRGIKNPIHPALASEVGMLAYSTAVGLMAFIASSSPFAYSLEYRLVKHELKWQYTLQAVGVTEPRQFFGEEIHAEFEPLEKKT